MAVTTTTLAVKDANNASQSLTTHTNPAGDEQYAVSLDRAGAAVYRASASFTPQATAAVTVLSIQGSATKTVRITKILIGGTSTASGSTLLQLQRTSALGAGGTTVNPTIGKVDSGTVASATAVVAHYTTTLKAAGTGVGGVLASQTVCTGIIAAPTTSGMVQPFLLFPEYGVFGAQALVLRGTADFLEVQNQNGGNLPAGTIYQYVIEWVEDAS